MSTRTGRYAAVTSTLALLVALGGTSYAAVQIGTKQLKNNAVTSAKIKNDAVTGQDVKESTLGEVPSAKKATSATTAGQATRATDADDADAVNDVTPSKVFLYTETSVTDRVLFSGSGLTITASCDAPNFNLDLVATTSKASSYLNVVGVADSNPTATVQSDFENSSFQPGTTVDLFLGDDGDTFQSSFTYSNADGSVVTGELSSDIGAPICSVRGMVFASS